MEMKELSNQVNKIEMPREMQERILRNCHIKTEEKIMEKNKTNKKYRKPAVAVAVLAICLSLTGITALAAGDKLKGYFRDIKRWDGAVTGTAYEQATDEVEITAVAEAGQLAVNVKMLNADRAPYAYIETMGIKEYKILDLEGNEIVTGEATEAVAVSEDSVIVPVSLEGVSCGNYKLVISKLVGGAKAEQPLDISGTWECEFTY